MATKVYTIKKDGKTLHKYQIFRNGLLEGWLVGESPETICQQHKWEIRECIFIAEPFSMWDIGDAIPVITETK